MDASSNNELARELHELPDLVVLAEVPSMEILDVSRHALVGLGYEQQDWIGCKLPEFTDQTDTGLNHELISLALTGETVRFDRQIRAADGSWRTYNVAARFVDDDACRMVFVGRDMDALAHSHSRLAGLLKLADLSDDIFVVWDEDGVVTYANDAAVRMHGEERFIGRNVSEFIHDDDDGLHELLRGMKEAGRAEGRVIGRRADGSPVHLGVKTSFDPATRQWFTVERDITDAIFAERELRRLNEHLRHQATTDTLTGVANRQALNDALAHAVTSDHAFALMALDMDDFKSVNDTLGHAVGDQFLRCVAQRIQGVVKLTDMVARVGGDEFVVYLPEVGVAEAESIAARVIEAVGRTYAIEGTEIVRSCSIGVALFEPGDDVNAVLRKADRASYQAKHAGRSRYALYRSGSS